MAQRRRVDDTTPIGRADAAHACSLDEALLLRCHAWTHRAPRRRVMRLCVSAPRRAAVGVSARNCQAYPIRDNQQVSAAEKRLRESEEQSAQTPRSRRATVAILDYGSQYTQLIARRVRESRVYCEIFPHDVTADELGRRGVVGVILSGG